MSNEARRGLRRSRAHSLGGRGSDSSRLFALTSVGPSGPVWKDVTLDLDDDMRHHPGPAALIFELGGSAKIPALGTPGLAGFAAVLGAAAFLALRRAA